MIEKEKKNSNYISPKENNDSKITKKKKRMRIDSDSKNDTTKRNITIVSSLSNGIKNQKKNAERSFSFGSSARQSKSFVSNGPRLESSWNLLADGSRTGHSRGNKRRKDREERKREREESRSRGKREKKRRIVRARARVRERERGGRKVHTRRSERIPAARVNIEVQGRRKTSPSRGTRVDDYGLIPLYAHSHQPT